jgi:uncharacterized RDD family membrane protein YckC
MTIEQTADLSAGPAGAPGRKGAWTDRSPHPWRRWGARMLDTNLMAFVTSLIAFGPAYLIAPEATERAVAWLQTPTGMLADSWLALFLAIPLQALLIGMTGWSVGKWVFGVKVLGEDGQPIGVGPALVRELRVLLTGLGLGLPLISLVTMSNAYSTLEERDATSWDEDQENVVLHRPGGVATTLLNAAGFAIVIVLLGYGVAERLINMFRGL